MCVCVLPLCEHLMWITSLYLCVKMHKFVQLWMFLLNIRWQIIVKSKQIFLHLLIVRGPGLSCCLKFCLLSWHFIHINGSPLCPSLPGTVLSTMSGPPLLFPSPSEGWSWLIQPSQSLWGGELTKSPLFRLLSPGDLVFRCLFCISALCSCLSLFFSLFRSALTKGWKTLLVWCYEEGRGSSP